MSEIFDKNRLVKNSLLLYIRMLFTMWLNLWATRLVLQNLGIEDMGVYGVVGSIVSLFTIFSGGITTAVQRFITYELGVKDGKPNLVFCSSLNVIFLVCLFLLVLLEVGGIWILYNKVNIPKDSLDVAFWVYQLSVITCLVNIISIPYNALIIAYEKMNAFATISIIQVVLTWISAYLLSFINDFRLLIYAISTATISIAIRVIYQIYCHRKFTESQFHWIIERSILKRMGRFMGITTVSSIIQLICSQGLVFVINWTFGVTINAVYNITNQLRNMVLSFAQNVQRAVAPQITKTYASGDIDHHKKLVFAGSKLQVFMIYFIIIPFLIRTNFIMRTWLGNVPMHAEYFAKCIVFVSLSYALLEPFRTAVNASNKIFQFTIIPDSVYLLVLPLSYAIGKSTGNPDIFMFTIVLIEIISVCLKIIYSTKIGVFRFSEILKNVLLPCAIVGFLDFVTCSMIDIVFDNHLVGFLILLLCNSLMLFIIIYIFGLNKAEKRLGINMAKKYIPSSFFSLLKPCIKYSLFVRIGQYKELLIK
ncbi:MAG: oligosaccharide flippase family protein [Prevotellaceae bacterium]|nr:oligosaccharide flippase family protein [Prevotellaceae bacterium]